MLPGLIANGDTGEVADDFYHKFQEDIDLMKSLGFKSYRMSISWPRILPDGTILNVNQKGVDFYHNVFDALLAAGITPFVTMYHWDLPTALMMDPALDGWLNPNIQDYFNDYAEFLFINYGSKIKHWLTFNEPHAFAVGCYGNGGCPPGRCSDYVNPDCVWVGGGGNSSTEPYIASHNVLLAHAKAAHTYRTKY